MGTGKNLKVQESPFEETLPQPDTELSSNPNVHVTGRVIRKMCEFIS